MFVDTKKRVFASLATLSIVFGLLAAYYVVASPTQTTAFGQAIIAAILLGVAAMVIHVMPAASPTVAQPAQPATREFGAAPFFENDVALAGLPGQSQTVAAYPDQETSSMPSVDAAPASLAVETHVTIAPSPPSPPPAIATPAPAPAAPPPEQWQLVEETAARAPSLEDHLASIQSDPGPSDPVRMADLQPADLSHMRNDNVLIPDRQEIQIAVGAAVTETAPPAPPEPAAAPARLSVRVQAAKAPQPTAVAEASPVGQQAVWKEPADNATPEQLRRLAEHWHAKYDVEHGRLETLWKLYETAETEIQSLKQRLARLQVEEASMMHELLANNGSSAKDAETVEVASDSQRAAS